MAQGSMTLGFPKPVYQKIKGLSFIMVCLQSKSSCSRHNHHFEE
jgi:hypothetical protein